MSEKHATIKQAHRGTLAAKADSGHWVMMDGGPTYGGSSAASNPKELLLIALGGCTANDVIPILLKMRAPVDDIEIRLTGTVRDEHPQIFTDIHIEYIVSGTGIEPADVERAIALSTEKYCSVSTMLRGNVDNSHSYKIITKEPASTEEELSVV